jgi:hypothetical protein
MKKIWMVLVVGITTLALAGCGESKVKMEVTAAEVQTMMSEVDTTAVLDDVVSLDMNVDFSLTMDTKQEGTVLETASLDVVGSINMVANLESYEAFYLKATMDLEITSDIPNMTEGFNLSNMTLKGNFYIINGNAYLDGQLKTNGISTTVQNKKTGFLTVEMYNELKLQLTSGTFDINPLITLDEEDNFTMYKVGDSYEFVLEMSKEDMVNLISELNDDTQMTVNFEDTDYLNVTVNFSETFERFRLDLNLNATFNYAESFFNSEVDGEFSLDMDLDFNLHAKLPNNLPQASEFDDFVEGGVFAGIGFPSSPAPTN